MKVGRITKCLLTIIISGFIFFLNTDEVLAENKVIDVSVYWDKTAAVTEDGSLWIWNENGIPVKSMNNVKAFEGDSSHYAVLKKDDTLWIWGVNSSGQLGRKTSAYYVEMSDAINALNDVKQVSLGETFSAAVKKDGSLWTWGYNSDGQLGTGNTETSYTPVKIMDDVKYISLGDTHSAAIKNDGSLWMWGWNRFGEIGVGINLNDVGEYDVCTPVKVMDDVKSVCLGNHESAAVKEDGSLWIWGYAEKEGSIIEYPEKVMDGVKSVSINNGMFAIIKNDNSLWMWGFNECGQLGDGTTTDKLQPIHVLNNVNIVGVSRIVSSDSTYAVSTAIKNDGSLWMWGSNELHQINSTSQMKIKTPLKIEFQKQQVISANNINKVVSSSDRTVDLNASCNGNAKLTYKSDNENISVNSNGVITIKKNYIGKAIITITAPETEAYAKATKQITVTVKPAKATINSLVYNNSGIVVKIKKNIGNVKYEIQYATNAEFNNAKKISNLEYNENGYKLTNPTKDKTYYFRVRGMKTVNDTVYLGAWSDVKQVSTKKQMQTITAKNIKKTVSSSKRTVSINASTNGNGKLTYKSDNKNITVDKNGKVTIKKNYIGKGTIIITAAATNKYKKATKKITVTVNPQKVTIKSVEYKDGKIAVKIKENIGNVKYEIEYRVGSSGEFKSTEKSKAVSYDKRGYSLISKVTKGKTYYFRVRGKKTVDGTTYLGEWSEVKKITIK